MQTAKTILLAALVLTMCTGAHAETITKAFLVKSVNYYGDVDGDGDREYGGCLIRVDPDPSTVLSGCGSKFVAPSCDGTYGTKSMASSVMDQATLAALTGRRITLGLDNSQKHSGRCYVNYAATSW